MSKSLGNGIDPMDVIEKYGCGCPSLVPLKKWFSPWSRCAFFIRKNGCFVE
ncbi:hypothetical protein, partial [Streptococcus agalactiae]|uniref:hypothetical protein n=1 Tax=Streptococcus agalactiae TaxID=1311 RepID=UPI0035ABE4ED